MGSLQEYLLHLYVETEDIREPVELLGEFWGQEKMFWREHVHDLRRVPLPFPIAESGNTMLV